MRMRFRKSCAPLTLGSCFSEGNNSRITPIFPSHLALAGRQYRWYLTSPPFPHPRCLGQTRTGCSSSLRGSWAAPNKQAATWTACLPRSKNPSFLTGSAVMAVELCRQLSCPRELTPQRGGGLLLYLQLCQWPRNVVR